MYPAIEPYETGHLDVGEGHSLYYELCGNPDGAPAVFLHGGPGGGLHEDMRRFFNPAHYRIILFEQRSTGRSTPYASIENNDIDRLVGDMETIRAHFGVEKWLIVGGSWGSALGLLYSVKHKERVSALILGGIFFADMEGVYWLTEEGGASEIMPEWFAPYRDFIPPEKRKDGLHRAYYEIILNGSEEEVIEAVRHAVVWDTAILTFELPVERIRHVEEHPEEYVALLKLWMHFSNNYYNAGNKRAILDGVRDMEDIPCHIIHGRFDLICPVKNAFELHQAYPGSHLHVLDKTGHTMREPNITAKLVEITDLLAEG